MVGGNRPGDGRVAGFIPSISKERKVARFQIVSFVNALKASNAETDYFLYEDEPPDEYRLYLLDTKTNNIVATDAGEPEDMRFDRDLDVFVHLLNKVAEGG